MLDRLKRLVFVPKCKSCHKLADKNNLCKVCEVKLERCRTENPTEFIKKDIKECDGVFASYDYTSTAKDVIKYAKFRNPSRFLNSFTEDVGRDILKIIKDNNVDVVVAVPSYKSKFYRQVFSLPDEMVKSLDKTGVKIDLGLIEKTRKTKTQHYLSEDERKINLLGAFKVKGDAENKNILIIDDVITSGSTISEIATELKLAGRGKVYAWRYTLNHR